MCQTGKRKPWVMLSKRDPSTRPTFTYQGHVSRQTICFNILFSRLPFSFSSLFWSPFTCLSPLRANTLFSYLLDSCFCCFPHLTLKGEKARLTLWGLLKEAPGNKLLCSQGESAQTAESPHCCSVTPGLELWPRCNEAGLMHLESPSLYPSPQGPQRCTDTGHVSVSAPWAVDSSHAAYMLSSVLLQEAFQHSEELDSSRCSRQGRLAEQRHSQLLFKYTKTHVQSSQNIFTFSCIEARAHF